MSGIDEQRESLYPGSYIAAAWQELMKKSNLSSKSAALGRQAAAFVSSLGKAVGFIDSTPASLPETAPGFLCERHVKFLSDIPRALGQTVRVYVTVGSRFGIEDYQRLAGALSQAGLGYRIFIIIVLGHALGPKNEARQERTGIVILDSDDIAQICMHPELPRAFYRLVRQQTHMDLIQPYGHFGAVRRTMFFGRQKELARIRLNADKSYAIYGGRRVGKTSLLTRVADELSEDSSNRPVFFSAQGVKDIADFSHRLLTSLLGTKVEPRALTRRFDLEQLRNDLKNEILLSGKRVTVLVDEVDGLVTVDRYRGEPMMGMLRSLSEDLRDRFRFVFAGFRHLYDRLIYYYSPAMNFLVPMPLGVLDDKAARQLIEIPFCHYMGYDMEPKVVDMVLDYSSRFPWQIQHFCGRLAQMVGQEQKDTVDEDDIQQVYEDFAFRSEVVETVLANLSDEQMAILCMFLDSAYFTRNDVYSAFEREQLPVDLVDVGRQLDRMVKFGVLSPPKKGLFAFAYAHLPTIIKEVEAPGQLLAQAKSKIKQRQKQRRR